MKTNSIGKSFTTEKIPKMSQKISWTFLGSLHDVSLKYVFHEML